MQVDARATTLRRERELAEIKVLADKLSQRNRQLLKEIGNARVAWRQRRRATTGHRDG
jgi:hypothetical protein